MTEVASTLESLIKTWSQESPDNRLHTIDGAPIFDEPLVGFASGDDPLFRKYKEVVGDFHLTPREALELAGCKLEDGSAVSIISWILPISRETRLSNRRMKDSPSRRWSHTYQYGEAFNNLLRRKVASVLREWGYQAVAPTMEGYFQSLDTPKGRASNWSERHVAYAAGLGTFSLTDGLITAKGMAMRAGSVVTDLRLPPSPRSYESPYEYCLFYRDGSCGVCIQRCPARAISPQGHDKKLCRQYVHERLEAWQKRNGVTSNTGCGLCQTAVPCEARIPRPSS